MNFRPKLRVFDFGGECCTFLDERPRGAFHEGHLRNNQDSFLLSLHRRIARLQLQGCCFEVRCFGLFNCHLLLALILEDDALNFSLSKRVGDSLKPFCNYWIARQVKDVVVYYNLVVVTERKFDVVPVDLLPLLLVFRP